MLPDWALAYDVLPDDDPNLGYRKFARDEARKAYRSGPPRLVIHWPEVRDAVAAVVGVGPDDGKINEVVAALKQAFRDGVVAHARHLRAIERVVAEAREEFGEDPLLPELRRVIDKGRGRDRRPTPAGGEVLRARQAGGTDRGGHGVRSPGRHEVKCPRLRVRAG